MTNLSGLERITRTSLWAFWLVRFFWFIYSLFYGFLFNCYVLYHNFDEWDKKLWSPLIFQTFSIFFEEINKSWYQILGIQRNWRVFEPYPVNFAIFNSINETLILYFIVTCPALHRHFSKTITIRSVYHLPINSLLYILIQVLWLITC